MTDAALPSVSVVVAAYQAERTIAACLTSLLGLDYPRDRLELLVVDNGSRDLTRQLASHCGDRIVVADEARRGPGAARNTGIRRARGQVIAVTDADAEVDRGWLRALIVPLTDESVGIAGGPILARPPATACELFGEQIHDQRSAILVRRPPYVVTANWAARRRLFSTLGLFDETLRRGEDVDFSWRAVAAGYRLVFCPDAVVYHRNERTLAGLAHEGFQHGFYGVRLGCRHAALVGRALRDHEPPPDSGRSPPAWLSSRFGLAFRMGKCLGRVCGRSWNVLGNGTSG